MKKDLFKLSPIERFNFTEVGILSGKTAIISGGTVGIGKDISFELAKQGANIVYVTHNVELAQRLLKELQEKYETKGEYINCLITDENQVNAMIKKVIEKFGSLDIAINNAGIEPEHPDYPKYPISEISEKDWDGLINNSLKGYFFSIKNELVQMQKQGKGVIINTALKGLNELKENVSLYYLAKSGISVLTKIAAIENKDSGVRVNMIYTDTEVESTIKIGEIVALICSDSYSDITGNVINVNLTK